jgi:hypothetical protein
MRAAKCELNCKLNKLTIVVFVSPSRALSLSLCLSLSLSLWRLLTIAAFVSPSLALTRSFSLFHACLFSVDFVSNGKQFLGAARGHIDSQLREPLPQAGTQFYGFTGTHVQILTQKALQAGEDVKIWTSNVRCKGDETWVGSCSHDQWGEQECEHDQVP